MSNALYIYTNRQNSGIVLVELGVIDMLRQKIDNIALFNPVATKNSSKNTEFLQNHFHLKQTPKEATGISLSQAEHLIATKGSKELFAQLIEQFTELKKRYDFVVCLGIESELFSNIVELDINIEIAKNFSCDIIPVIAPHETENLADAVMLQKRSIQKASMEPLAIIINKAKQKTNIQGCYTIKYHEELSKLCIADITDTLNIVEVFAKEEDYAKKISSLKVVALGVDNFLKQIQQDDLLIFPADRSEIILALIASYYSGNFPKISGVVFSFGEKPNNELVKLLQGLKNFHIPMVLCKKDTYQTAQELAKLKPRFHQKDTKKTAMALGLFYKYVDSHLLLQKINLTKESILTPMMFEHQLFAKARENKKTIVLPEGDDERILRACETILHKEIANIILLDVEKKAKEKIHQMGLDLNDATIIDPTQSKFKNEFATTLYELRKHKGLTKNQAYDAITHPNYFATMMVHLGYADGMVSGAKHSTAETIRPALQIIKTKPDISKVSSIFFMCLETKVLVFGDCAINQNPTPKELSEIAHLSAKNAEKFGIEPKVATISYSSGSSAKGNDVEMVKEATRLMQHNYPQITVDGPMQFDTAFDKETAKKKMPNSKVAGRASVFIFPDLNTGNTTYKAVQRSSGALAIGPILQGLNKPINDLSRGCLVEDILNTIAITAIMAEEN